MPPPGDKSDQRGQDIVRSLNLARVDAPSEMPPLRFPSDDLAAALRGLNLEDVGGKERKKKACTTTVVPYDKECRPRPRPPPVKQFPRFDDGFGEWLNPIGSGPVEPTQEDMQACDNWLRQVAPLGSSATGNFLRGADINRAKAEAREMRLQSSLSGNKGISIPHAMRKIAALNLRVLRNEVALQILGLYFKQAAAQNALGVKVVVDKVRPSTSWYRHNAKLDVAELEKYGVNFKALVKNWSARTGTMLGSRTLDVVKSAWHKAIRHSSLSTAAIMVCVHALDPTFFGGVLKTIAVCAVEDVGYSDPWAVKAVLDWYRAFISLAEQSGAAEPKTVWECFTKPKLRCNNLQDTVTGWPVLARLVLSLPPKKLAHHRLTGRMAEYAVNRYLKAKQLKEFYMAEKQGREPVDVINGGSRTLERPYQTARAARVAYEIDVDWFDDGYAQDAEMDLDVLYEDFGQTADTATPMPSQDSNQWDMAHLHLGLSPYTQTARIFYEWVTDSSVDYIKEIRKSRKAYRKWAAKLVDASTTAMQKTRTEIEMVILLQKAVDRLAPFLADAEHRHQPQYSSWKNIRLVYQAANRDLAQEKDPESADFVTTLYLCYTTQVTARHDSTEGNMFISMLVQVWFGGMAGMSPGYNTFPDNHYNHSRVLALDAFQRLSLGTSAGLDRFADKLPYVIWKTFVGDGEPTSDTSEYKAAGSVCTLLHLFDTEGPLFKIGDAIMDQHCQSGRSRGYARGSAAAGKHFHTIGGRLYHPDAKQKERYNVYNSSLGKGQELRYHILEGSDGEKAWSVETEFLAPDIQTALRYLTGGTADIPAPPPPALDPLTEQRLIAEQILAEREDDILQEEQERLSQMSPMFDDYDDWFETGCSEENPRRNYGENVITDTADAASSGLALLSRGKSKSSDKWEDKDEAWTRAVAKDIRDKYGSMVEGQNGIAIEMASDRQMRKAALEAKLERDAAAARKELDAELEAEVAAEREALLEAELEAEVAAELAELEEVVEEVIEEELDGDDGDDGDEDSTHIKFSPKNFEGRM